MKHKSLRFIGAVAARFGAGLGRWLPAATALALGMAAGPAKAASIELLWQNGQPHPDFNGELHEVFSVKGILEDGTVIYQGTLTPDPPTPTSYRYGYFYVRPGERPKPLGGLSYYENIEQVLPGDGNQLAVVYWPRVFPASARGEIHVGTPEALGPTLFLGGPVSSSSDLPQLLQLYGPDRLAFRNGARIYRTQPGTNQQIIGPDVTLPNVPALTGFYSYSLSHMAADGRAVINAKLSRGGYEVGSMSWWVDNGIPATYHLIHLDDGGYMGGTPNKIFTPDPSRSGWGLYVSPGAANRTGLYGATGVRVNLNATGSEYWVGVQSIGGSPQILSDPQATGGGDFDWFNNFGSIPNSALGNVQMDAQGVLFTRGPGVFSQPPTQRNVMAFFNANHWQRLVTEGDALPGLPANVLVGPNHSFTLENGGLFVFRSNLTGPGVTSTNNTAWWLGRKTGDSVTFDLLVRAGQALSFTGALTAPLSLSPPTGEDDYWAPIGNPDAGRRRTMSSAGWMAQRFSTTGAGNPGGLFLLRPDSQPVVRMQTIKVSNGSVVLKLSGVVGTQYDVQRAIAANGPWTNLTTITAPAGGQFGYTNNLPPQPKAFYRLQQH